MYDYMFNQGMWCIKEILDVFEVDIDWELFDVCGSGVVLDLDFDIYILIGGFGSFYDGDGIWDVCYYDLLIRLWDWNVNLDNF